MISPIALYAMGEIIVCRDNKHPSPTRHHTRQAARRHDATKKARCIAPRFILCFLGNRYFLTPTYSSETVNFLLPFARRAARTRRPLAVDILSRKPCLFFLLRFDGWYVLFITLVLFYIITLDNKLGAKIGLFSIPYNPSIIFAAFFCAFCPIGLPLQPCQK